MKQLQQEPGLSGYLVFLSPRFIWLSAGLVHLIQSIQSLLHRKEIRVSILFIQLQVWLIIQGRWQESGCCCVVISGIFFSVCVGVMTCQVKITFQLHGLFVCFVFIPVWVAPGVC